MEEKINGEGIEIEQAINLNRSERRKKLKFYKKELKLHMKKKPKVDIYEMDEEAQVNGIEKVRAWGTRYGILMRKIAEYES